MTGQQTLKTYHLTEEDLRPFSLPAGLCDYIESARAKLGLAKEELRILDYGCGRGRSVIRLREQGYDARGVDISNWPIKNGRPLLRRRGWDAEAILRVLDESGAADFPDAFFHVVFSWQVLEHVQSLGRATAKIRRLTAPGGTGVHWYPGHRRLIEGHSRMPLIHWLPKNALRKPPIYLFALLHIGPRGDWGRSQGAGLLERARNFYQYSLDHTYYRTPAAVRGAFEECGFQVTYDRHPAVRDICGTLRRRCKLLRVVPFRYLLDALEWTRVADLTLSRKCLDALNMRFGTCVLRTEG